MTVPTHRIATHPGALLREQIEESGLSVHGVARTLACRQRACTKSFTSAAV